MPMFEKRYSRVHSPALGMMSFRGGMLQERGTNSRNIVFGKGWDRAQVERSRDPSAPVTGGKVREGVHEVGLRFGRRKT